MRAKQVYRKEPKVECPTCRTVSKLSTIVEVAGTTASFSGHGGGGGTSGGGRGHRTEGVGGGGVGSGGVSEHGAVGSGKPATALSPGRECVVCLHATPTVRFNACGHLCVCTPCFSLYLESKNITVDGPTRKRFAMNAGQGGSLGWRMESGESGGGVCEKYHIAHRRPDSLAFDDSGYDEEQVAAANDTWMG